MKVKINGKSFEQCGDGSHCLPLSDTRCTRSRVYPWWSKIICNTRYWFGFWVKVEKIASVKLTIHLFLVLHKLSSVWISLLHWIPGCCFWVNKKNVEQKQKQKYSPPPCKNSVVLPLLQNASSLWISKSLAPDWEIMEKGRWERRHAHRDSKLDGLHCFKFLRKKSWT